MITKQVIFLAPLLCSGWAVRGASLNISGDFEAQARHLLSEVMLTSEEVHNILRLYVGLQDTLRTRWKGAELHLYGSIRAGLATKTSDVDFYVQIPSYNASADRYFAFETYKVLLKEPKKYIFPEYIGRMPLLSFYNVAMQRHIDLTFDEYSVETSKLVYYHLHLDERYWRLAAIVKYWFKVKNLRGAGGLSNYALYLMTILFLQQKNMSPSVFARQAHSPLRNTREWNADVGDIPFTVQNNESLYELLGGFFKYYSEFNFKDYCVSTFVGRAVLRGDLEDIRRIPEEFSLYKRLIGTGQQAPLALHYELCVQDPIRHNMNVVRQAAHNKISTFISELKIAAKMYDEVPRDRYLGSILFVDEHKQSTLAEARTGPSNISMLHGLYLS